MIHYGHYIGGKNVKSTSGREQDVFQPLDGTVRAKVALILFLSWWMGKYQRRSGEFLKGFVLPIACTVPMFALMVRQQDFGTTAIMLAIVAAILFCGGTNLFHLGLVAVLAATGLAITTT